MWLQKPKKKKMILFLCTGDTCRGPMAAGYLRKLLAEREIKDIEVRSSGVMTATGLLSTPESNQLLLTVEVDLRRHRSTQLTSELIRKADLILGMTPFHVQFALRMSEEAKDKTFLFKEYTGSDPKNYQITDPMGHTLEVYKRVFREIRQACDFLADKEVISGKPPEKPKTKEPKKPATKVKKKAGDHTAKTKTPPKPTTPKANAKPATASPGKKAPPPETKPETKKPSAKAEPPSKAPPPEGAKPATTEKAEKAVAPKKTAPKKPEKAATKSENETKAEATTKKPSTSASSKTTKPKDQS